MTKLEIFIFQIIVTILVLAIGYGVLAFTAWLETLDIPIPVLIIGFCSLLYITLRKEACR
jgi:hypothetical protein